MPWYFFAQKRSTDEPLFIACRSTRGRARRRSYCRCSRRTRRRGCGVYFPTRVRRKLARPPRRRRSVAHRLMPRQRMQTCMAPVASTIQARSATAAWGQGCSALHSPRVRCWAGKTCFDTVVPVAHDAGGLVSNVAYKERKCGMVSGGHRAVPDSNLYDTRFLVVVCFSDFRYLGFDGENELVSQ